MDDLYLEAEQQRHVFVEALHAQIGKPYIWGAQDPQVGFDCSGLIVYALRQSGFDIPDMTAQGLADHFHRCRILGMGKPGELCFYGNGATDANKPVYHVMAVLTTWGQGMPILVGSRGGIDTTTTPNEAYRRGAYVCTRTSRYWRSNCPARQDRVRYRW